MTQHTKEIAKLIRKDVKPIICKPWRYEPIREEDLAAEASKHMEGYTERSDSYYNAAYRMNRRRLVVTWMLSYGMRPKYTKAIALASGLNLQRCNVIFKEEMRRAWVAYQENEGE